MMTYVKKYVEDCTSSESGKKLFNIIKPMLDRDENIDLSFKDMKNLTTVFIDSAFGELLQHFVPDFIQEKLTFYDIPKGDMYLISKRMVYNAQNITEKVWKDF